jgi:hypothetical protein
MTIVSIVCPRAKGHVGDVGKLMLMSRGSAVGIETGCRLDDRGVGVQVPVGSRIFTYQYRADRLCGPPTFPSDEYWGLFRRE